jgi:hypothetical protein
LSADVGLTLSTAHTRLDCSYRQCRAVPLSTYTTEVRKYEEHHCIDSAVTDDWATKEYKDTVQVHYFVRLWRRGPNSGRHSWGFSLGVAEARNTVSQSIFSYQQRHKPIRRLLCGLCNFLYLSANHLRLFLKLLPFRVAISTAILNRQFPHVFLFRLSSSLPSVANFMLFMLARLLSI